MSPQAALNWKVHPSVLIDGIDDYGDRLFTAIQMLLTAFSPLLEDFAKAYAPWTDRTANARQSLFSVVDADIAGRKVVLYLSHGMEYGVYLELRWQGKYAIIMPTIHAYENQVMNEVRYLMK